MKQILLIHGGNSFSSYSAYLDDLKSLKIDYERMKPSQKWKSWIAEKMPECDVLQPTFPNGFNAVYDEWAIYFEKLIPFFREDVSIVGHSLGAMFITKYLNQHQLPKKIKQLILISGQYGDSSEDDTGSFLVTTAKGLENSAEEIHLFFSKDDIVVNFDSIYGFQADLPGAISHIFENRGHFNDATFPELLDILKQK